MVVSSGSCRASGLGDLFEELDASLLTEFCADLVAEFGIMIASVLFQQTLSTPAASFTDRHRVEVGGFFGHAMLPFTSAVTARRLSD